MLHSVQVVRMGAVIALWLCSFVSVGFAQGKTCEQCHPDANFKLDASPQHHTLATIHQGDWSKKGADTCLKCHDEDNEVPVVPIFQTKHGRAADPASPFAGLQCEACHGPGEAHAQKTNGASRARRSSTLAKNRNNLSPSRTANV